MGQGGQGVLWSCALGDWSWLKSKGAILAGSGLTDAWQRLWEVGTVHGMHLDCCHLYESTHKLPGRYVVLGCSREEAGKYMKEVTTPGISCGCAGEDARQFLGSDWKHQNHGLPLPAKSP